MSYSVAFTGDGEPDVFPLATTGGLAALGRWAESLPDHGFAAVKALLDAGTVEGTDALAAQLKDALERHEPAEQDVGHTARNLLDQVGVGDAKETATVVGD